MSELVLTRAEITALSDFAHDKSRVRTYRIVRDTHSVLYVKEPSGRLIRLTPEYAR